MEVDFVITWVNGDDPNHIAKRALYSPEKQADIFSGESDAPLRWQDNNEVLYCLKSIDIFAPWVRKIWIVTDGQTPNFESLGGVLRKIEIVDHSQIFIGYEDLLPTFNSISIENMLWRIPGLSENFVYFNDDVFLTNPTVKKDFFYRDGVIFRGSAMDFTRNRSILYNIHKINALHKLDNSLNFGYSNAHVAISSKKSWFKNYFAENEKELRGNAVYRFRNEMQFSPFALATFRGILDGLVYAKRKQDWSVCPVELLKNGTDAQIDKRLKKISNQNIIMACINDFNLLRRRGWDIEEYFSNKILRKSRWAGRRRAVNRLRRKRRLHAPSGPDARVHGL